MTSNCWYSKWLSQKMTPVCEGMFQIWPIGMKLWDKTFNFEDKIELLVLKMIVSKRMTAVCKGMFQIWPIGMELWDKTFNFEDNIGLLVLKMIVSKRMTFWVPTTLFYLQNWMFCPITSFQLVKFETFLHKQGSFFETIILSTNNLMSSSKLNILSHNSIPSGQIWKFLHEQGHLFQTIIWCAINPILSSKLHFLSHISVYLNIICSTST